MVRKDEVTCNLIICDDKKTVVSSTISYFEYFINAYLFLVFQVYGVRIGNGPIMQKTYDEYDRFFSTVSLCLLSFSIIEFSVF